MTQCTRPCLPVVVGFAVATGGTGSTGTCSVGRGAQRRYNALKFLEDIAQRNGDTGNCVPTQHPHNWDYVTCIYPSMVEQV